jgi:hypothetical protein
MDDIRALVGMRFAHISGRQRIDVCGTAQMRSAPLRVGSGLVRAPNILPAHHSVIGKCDGFLTSDPADGTYQSGQRIGGKTGLT